jgi:PAS domain S-box-containing protein
MQRFGSGGENLIGQTASGFFSQIVPDIEKARRGDVAATEYYGIYNGAPWYFQNYLFPDMFHDGHLIGFALDITERVKVEEELRHSRANLAAVFDSTIDSICAIGRDYSIMAYNTSFANYCREIHNVEPVIGMPISAVIGAGRHALWQERYDRAFAGENFSIELSVPVHDDVVYFEVNLNPVRDSGEIIGVVMFSKNVTERKKTEEILKENLATLNTVLESTTNSIFAIDNRYHFLSFNSRLKDTFKKVYNTDVEVGRNILELMTRDSDREKSLQHFDRAMREGAFTTIYGFENADMSQGYFEVSYNPIKTDTGEILGITVYSQDITERKNAEQELHRTMVLQQAIMDAADVSIISTSTDGTIVTFNRAAERMLGYTAAEVIGKTTPAIFHDPVEIVQRSKTLSEELGIPIEPGLHTFVAKARLGYADENEWTYIRKDGSRFPVLLSLTGLHEDNNSNNLTGFLGIGVDITERKQAEQLLLKIQNDLLEAQRIAKVGSFEIDPETQYGVWTKQAALIYGCDENTAMAEMDFRRFIHPDDVDIVLTDWKATIENGTVISRDFRINRMDGSAASINVFGKPVFDEAGQLIAIKGTIQDITERKEHERELITARDAANSANRAKSEFLANMSHEIRTPMNSVLGFTELLLNLVQDEQQVAYLQAITTSGKMLLRLINDILDLSKVEAGRFDFRYVLEDIGFIIEETRQIFAIRIRDKKLDFFIDNDVQLPFVLDAARLRQILLNIVGNAVKFTDEGYIRVSARIENNSGGNRLLRIAVEDSGIGIPEGQQTMIFEAFRQQDGQSTRRYGGTGLGLTITKRLVEAMNGSINVRSTIDVGSVFEIVLPEAIPSSTINPINDIAYEATIRFQNSLVLVVDDNELNRRLVREMLQRSELQLLEAATGEEAVQMAVEHRPDMILMDLHLPDINGDVAIDKIRAMPGLEAVPVVFLTASAMKEDAPAGTTLARETYLYKPVSKKDLIRTLALFLPYSTGVEQPPLVVEPESSYGIPEVPLDDIPAEAQEILPDLLTELREEYMPVWRELNDAPILHEVEQFAQGLCNLGEHYHIAMIQRYGELLGEQVKMVNVVDFPVTLAQFPALVESVESVIR